MTVSYLLTLLPTFYSVPCYGLSKDFSTRDQGHRRSFKTPVVSGSTSLGGVSPSPGAFVFYYFNEGDSSAHDSWHGVRLERDGLPGRTIKECGNWEWKKVEPILVGLRRGREIDTITVKVFC